MTATFLPFVLIIWSDEYKRYIVQNYFCYIYRISSIISVHRPRSINSSNLSYRWTAALYSVTKKRESILTIVTKMLIILNFWFYVNKFIHTYDFKEDIHSNANA
jgi:hypothetical protein